MRRILLLTAALSAPLTGGGCRDNPPSPPARDESAKTPSQDQTQEPSAAGSRSQRGEEGAVRLEITAEVRGKSYRAAGPGQCEHTIDASIYQVPAALWTARYSGEETAGLERVNLTIWEPKAGGAAQVSLALRTGEQEHQIATVQGGQREGKGSAVVRQSGRAGTLTVEGESGEGIPVRVTVSCPSFTAPIAEGG
jgi:hypothetical protein